MVFAFLSHVRNISTKLFSNTRIFVLYHSVTNL